MIKFVKNQDENWRKKKLDDVFRNFKEFLQSKEDRINFDEFFKFLDNYESFIKTTSIEVCEFHLGNLSKMLGYNLQDEYIFTIIETRPTSFFNMDNLKLKEFYKSICKDQEKGE